MNQVLEFADKVVCPISGRTETVYTRCVLYNGEVFAQPNGCDSCHGDPACNQCMKNKFDEYRAHPEYIERRLQGPLYDINREISEMKQKQ